MESQMLDSTTTGRARRILFIQLQGSVRDLVIALPSIHALARSNPEAEVEVMTSPENGALLDGDPHVKKIWVVGPSRSSTQHAWRLQREDLDKVLGEESFDVVVSDSNDDDLASLIDASNARVKIGVPWCGESLNQAAEEQLLHVLAQERLIEPHLINHVGRIALSDHEVRWARCWRGNNLHDRYATILLNPDGESAVNSWPAENFVTVGRWLASHHHCNLVILSGEDTDLAREIAAQIGRAATLLTRCAPRQLAAIASLSSLVISTDSGPARIAAAAGSRAIVLFGPTSAARNALRPPHINIRSPRPCDERTQMDFVSQANQCETRCLRGSQSSCLNDIPPDVVIRAAERALHA